MLKFFSAILNKKKAISFLLLFFILAGIGLSLPNPNKARALFDCGPINRPAGSDCTVSAICNNDCADGLKCAGDFGTNFWGATIGKCVPKAPEDMTVLERTVNSIGDSLLNGLAKLVLAPAAVFFNITSLSLKLVIEFSTGTISYTNLPAILAGWAITRNLGNIVIVLALIVIALATILRFRNYEAKQLLARLIIAALLINFSLVICGVIIDASNITMKYLLLGGAKKVNNEGAWIYGGDAMDEALNTQINGDIGGPEIPKEPSSHFIIRVMGKVFFWVIRGTVSLLYAFLFIFRIAALWILVILSPLALACAVLPLTRSLVYEKWLSNFLQWCFIGIFGGMFLYIGDKIANVTNAKYLIQTPTSDNAIYQIAYQIIYFFLPGAFVVLGFMFSIQLSAMGSSGAIGAFRWTKGKMIGAAKGDFGWLGRNTRKALTGAGGAVAERTGLDKVAQRAYNGLANNRLVNWARDKISGPGASNAAREERNKARIDKDFEKNIQHENDIGKLTNYRNSTTTTDSQKAVIDKRLAEMGSFNQIGKFDATKLTPEQKQVKEKQQKEQQRVAIENMVYHGMDIKEVLKKAPSLAGYDPNAFSELKGQQKASGKYTTDEAVRETLNAKAFSKLEVSDMRKMSFSDPKDIFDLIANASIKKLGKASEEFSISQENNFRAVLPEIEKEIKILKDAGATKRAAINAAAAAGNTKLEAKYTEEINKMNARQKLLVDAHREIESWNEPTPPPPKSGLAAYQSAPFYHPQPSSTPPPPPPASPPTP